MDISSLISPQSLLSSNRLAENVLNLKVGQQLDVKVIGAEIQAIKNAIALTLGGKDITVQSNQLLTLNPGQDLKIQVTQIAPVIEFKILDSLLPELEKQITPSQDPKNPPAELRLKLISTSRDGGSAASGREPLRPTARDGGSAASGREPLRSTARDGGSAASAREPLLPTARDGGSVASVRLTDNDGTAFVLTARQALDAKIIGIAGNKIQLQVFIPTSQATTESDAKQVITIDLTQLTNAPSNLKAGQSLNIELVKPGGMAEFKVIPAGSGQALAAKITGISGDKIQLQVLSPSTTESGNTQIIAIDRTQLANAPSNLKAGQSLNLELIKPAVLAEFKVIPADSGQALAAKITGISGDKIQLQVLSPTATEAGNKQASVMNIDRTQLTNAPSNLKAGQSLNLELIKPAVLAEFKVIPADSGQALAAKITGISGDKIQLQVLSPSTTESGNTQIIAIDRTQLANAPSNLKAGQSLNLELIKPAALAEFKVIPAGSGQALAAKITGISGDKIQLQVLSPTTTESGNTQIIAIDRTQLANAPSNLKAGQSLNIELVKPAALAEFKVIPAGSGQALAAKITGISGDKIQLQVLSPTATEAGNKQASVMNIDRTQLTNAPSSLKAGQSLNLELIKPAVLAEFKVIPADSGQALAAKITGISGDKIQLQVLSPTATESGDTQVINIDRTQLTNAPSSLKAGQSLNLETIKPGTLAEFKVVPVANDGGQALAVKITGINGDKIQLQLLSPTTTESGDTQVINIDRIQLTNAPSSLRVGQSLNLEPIKPAALAEFKVIPTDSGQALTAKITGINGDKIQLQVLSPTATEAGDTQIINIDRTQLTNAPSSLKTGQSLNLELIKPAALAEFKVIPADSGQALTAKITGINGDKIQLQLLSPSTRAAGDTQIINIDRTQLSNAPQSLKVGQSLNLEPIKPAALEFKVIPTDSGQALAAKITGISGDKIQLQVLNPSTTEAGNKQASVMNIDRTQLTNAPSNLKVGQSLNLEPIKPGTLAEFKVVPVANDGGQALVAKITGINGDKIQLQVLNPTTTELGNKQASVMNIDRTQLTNAPSNLKVGQSLNLELVKPEGMAEFKVIPADSGQALAAKITGISGDKIQLQVLNPSTTEAGNKQASVMNIDRTQLTNAPSNLKVGQSLSLELVKPEGMAEFKVIPADSGQALAAKITGINGDKIQLQVFSPTTTESGNKQASVMNIDRTQLSNAPQSLKVGQKLNLETITPETRAEFKIIPANEGGQALAAKITGISGDKIQLQVLSPTTTETDNMQVINTNRAQLTNAPADLKVGQKLNLETIKPETRAEFKVIPANEGSQMLAAKITGISGNNIQLQVSSPMPTEAGATKAITIDRTQLTNAPADLKVGQKLNLETIKPETRAEFKVIPANEGSQMLAAKITGINGNNIQLQVSSPTPTEAGATKAITIDRTQLTNAPADLKIGQNLNLAIIKPETAPEFRIIPVANNIPEAKITEFIKQFLPRHEASPIFLNQLIKDLPQLMKNKTVPQTLKDIAAKIIGNLPPKEQLITSQGLKQAIANSGLFLEAKLPLAMPQAELIKELPQLIKNESVPKSLQRIAVEILQNLTQKEPAPNSLVLEQPMTKSTLTPDAALVSLKLNPSDDSIERAGIASQTGDLAGNGLQVGDFKENLLKFIHALKQELSQQTELQGNQVDLDLLKNLQNKTENTVAKIVLDQLMSLPKGDSPTQLWVVDIPFIDRQQAETVKIEIQQDKENKQQFGASDWSVNITIAPPELGTIHCIVSYRNNAINTYFKSQSTQTTELIKSNLEYLKNQLEKSGLTTGHMDAQAGSQKTQVPQQLTGQKLFDENA